jgi:hypothetical protein
MASIWDDLESQGPSPEKTPVAKATTGGSIWDSLEAPATETSKNAPGFIADIKRGTGQVVSSFGSTLQDLGAEGVGESIEKYGKEVVTRNPSQINTVEQAISSPFTTAREAVGEIVPQVGTAVGFGIGGRIIGGALGSLAGPAGTVVGQQVGGVAGAYLGNLAQSYGGIRSEQRASGDEDIVRALGSGAVSAGLDTALGAERIATKVLGKGSSFIARESGEKLLPHVGKQFARGFAEEAGTEVLQTGIERFGAFKDLTGDEALNEYGLAAIKGGFGGGAVRGGLASVAGQRDSGSILGDVNDVGNQGTTETNAINSAIDSNSPEVMGPLPEQMGPPEVTGPRQIDVSQVAKTPIEQATEQAAEKQAQEAEAIAAEQERLKQVNEVRQSVFQKYGGVVQPLGQKSAYNFQGKIYYTENQLNQALDKLTEAEAQKSEIQLIVEGAYAAANKLVGGKMLTPAALQKAVAPYVDQAESKEEILARVELDLQQALQNVKSPQQLAKVEPLHALRDELAGIPVEQRVSTVDLLPKAEPKGKQDERLQLESNAGLRTVSEQGGAVEGNGTGAGLLRPSSVQPIEPGSVTQGQTSQQVGAVPAGGVRVGTNVRTAGGPSVQGGQDARQTEGKGQVNGTQGTAQTGRGSVPDKTATGSATTAEAEKITAEDVVKQVIGKIIETVVVRKGRMKAEDLPKLRDFIYYDHFQIENKKEGKDGLSKKELAEMHGVSTDTIDGWQDIADNFFEENRGAIQKDLYEALDKNGMTYLEFIEAIEARRDKVENEAVILEEAEAALAGEGEKLSKDEAELEEAARGELEGFKLDADESTLDQRDLASETGGMSVSEGRVQGSIQEQNKPEETINARMKRKLEAYNKAIEKGDEELEAKLMAEIDELTQEAKKIADKQVARAEALAPKKKAAEPKKEPKKRKKVEDAVQEPSAEKVPVREGTGSSEGVRKEDTKKREAATESKTDEEAGAEAWDEGVKDFPEAPKFKDLSEEQQKDWIDFGPENWTKADVQTELIKLAKEMKVPAKSMQKSFSENNPLIDPLSEEVDAALRGKSIKEAVQWALKNVRNEYERMVLRSIEARLRELTDLGIEFSFKLTDPGKQLVGNMLGVSTISPAGLGSAQKVDVILNGAHTGEKAGTNYETLVHELLHAVTQAQLRIAPDGTAAKELRALYNEIIAQFNARAKAGKLTPFEQKFFKRENNSLEDSDELLAWGLTNKEFQEYLASITVSGKVTLWDKFVRAIGKLLGSPVKADSALGQLLSISENLLTESMTPYVTEANKRFQSLGKQPNPTQFPNWSINPELGAPVWVEGDYALYKAMGSKGNTLFIPGSRTGDTSSTARVDVSQFSGNQIPALVLAQMKVVADSMRPTSSAVIKKPQQGNIQKLPKQLQGPVSEITATINDLARRGLNYWSFTEQLAERASKYIKSAKDYVALVREQQAVKTRYERRVDLILQQYDKLDAKFRGTGSGSVNAFLKAATMAGKWAYDPGYLKKSPELDVGLKAQFDALPKSVQDVIKAVFKHGHDTLQDMKKGVIDNITSEYDALIKAARDSNDIKELALLEKKKAKALKDYSTLMAIQAGKPYAPLKRFGNFVVVAKSDDYLEQEAIIKNDKTTDDEKKEARSKLRELEKSEEHYYVSFAETKREGRKIEEQLRTEGYGYVSEAFEKDSTKTDVYGGRDVQNVFYRLRNLAEDSLDENTGGKSTKAINRLINDLHLTLLAEQSARQSERRRKGIAGAEDDMMRAFATQGMATAHFIATLHNSGKIYESLQKMQKEADAQTPGRDVRREFYNEFMKRHALGLDYQPNSILNKALGTTSFWMLLTNPAYYLQNMTQPFMLSLPFVAGKHGYDKSWVEFSKAYKEMFQLINKEGLSEESYAKLPADVRDAVETLVNSGRIDISLDQDLGRWRDNEGSKTEVAGKVIEKLRGVAQDIESINRVATAVAAYRLEKASGSTADQAIAYANQVILDTHGDYSGFNAPRITRQGLGRLATQFRKFQLIQLSLMAKLVKQSFVGASPEEKMVARRALGFTLSHTLAAGGLMGFPGFAAIAWVMGAAFGDEDEPDNPELTLRRMIGNKELADVLLKGAPKYFGVDLSGKLGMGQMLSVLPYTDVDLSKAGIAQAGYALLTGPTGSLVQRAGEGLGLMADGEYYKGVEKFMPAVVAQSMKAARFGLMDGITLKNGDVVMKPDEIDFLDMLSVAIGLPSNKITDRQFVQGVAIETDKFYKDRTSEIKRDYVKAVKEKDTAGMAEARKEWMDLQNAKVKQKLQRQPLSDLMKAPQEQKKRERNVESGVPVSKSNKQFIKEVSKL